METLITLLIFAALTALSAWLKKKQQSQQPPEEWWPGSPRSPQPPDAASPPKPVFDWEEQMRRLLEGAKPAEPPPPARPAQTAPPAPPPIPRPARAEVPRPPRPGPSQPPVVRPKVMVQAPPQPTAKRAAAGPATVRAVTQPKAARIVAEAPAMPQAAALAPHRSAVGTKVLTAAARQATELLRQRTSLRSVILAAVILGPPRAEERLPGWQG